MEVFAAYADELYREVRVFGLVEKVQRVLQSEAI